MNSPIIEQFAKDFATRIRGRGSRIEGIAEVVGLVKSSGETDDQLEDRLLAFLMEYPRP
jgi:hypothetical protein